MFHYDQEIFKNKQVEKANFLTTGVYKLVHDLAKKWSWRRDAKFFNIS